MYAMFGLGMEDVFSSGDFGLRVAMETHLEIPPKQKPAVYDQRALRWRPYRTMASLHLWHSLKPDAERLAK
jgi:3-methyladenine DNA glycosylase/8-oxoguanine DNA glycosylase